MISKFKLAAGFLAGVISVGCVSAEERFVIDVPEGWRQVRDQQVLGQVEAVYIPQGEAVSNPGWVLRKKSILVTKHSDVAAYREAYSRDLAKACATQKQELLVGNVAASPAHVVFAVLCTKGQKAPAKGKLHFVKVIKGQNAYHIAEFTKSVSNVTAGGWPTGYASVKEKVLQSLSWAKLCGDLEGYESCATARKTYEEYLLASNRRAPQGVLRKRRPAEVW